jgi:hypothetical protein
MGKTSNAAKQRWNVSNYSQLKVSLPKDEVDAFKANCKKKGVSIASEIARLIGAGGAVANAINVPVARLDTRSRRRKALKAYIGNLSELREAEYLYMTKIPENMLSGDRYSDAENCVSVIDEAINILYDAY